MYQFFKTLTRRPPLTRIQKTPLHTKTSSIYNHAALITVYGDTSPPQAAPVNAIIKMQANILKSVPQNLWKQPVRVIVTDPAIADQKGEVNKYSNPHIATSLGRIKNKPYPHLELIEGTQINRIFDSNTVGKVGNSTDPETQLTYVNQDFQAETVLLCSLATKIWMFDAPPNIDGRRHFAFLPHKGSVLNEIKRIQAIRFGIYNRMKNNCAHAAMMAVLHELPDVVGLTPQQAFCEIFMKQLPADQKEAAREILAAHAVDQTPFELGKNYPTELPTSPKLRF